jgi:hypothetical protein
MLQSPEIAQFIGAKAAEKSGMADELQAYKEQNAAMSKFKMQPAIGSKGGEPRSLNIKTDLGAEMADVAMNPAPTRNTAVV